MELVDMSDSKSLAFGRGGSTPPSGTTFSQGNFALATFLIIFSIVALCPDTFLLAASYCPATYKSFSPSSFLCLITALLTKPNFADICLRVSPCSVRTPTMFKTHHRVIQRSTMKYRVGTFCLEVIDSRSAIIYRR